MKRLIPAVLLLAACGGARPETTVPAPPPTAVAPSEAAPAIANATPAAAPAPAAHAKATKVRTIEGITEYRMDNGLQVLLFPDATQSTVTVNITYLVGSRLEGYGETGMAHLLEHMMFKGSPRHRNVLKILQERGGQANGSTYYDRTNYFETLPSSQENLDYALDLESDRMINAMVSPDDLKTEFSVVRNEFESGENHPQNVLDERVDETAFLWHNYGKPTIGSRSDIERVPVPALRAFYEKYYQPDDAMLVVAGKFDQAAALGSIEKFFGAIPKPTRQLTGSYSVEPQQDGERSVTLRRTGDVTALLAAYHTVSGASPDLPAVQAAIDVLTREPSGRLYKKLVETKLAASVYGYNQAFHDPSLAKFGVTIRDPKNLDKVEQVLTSEIENLAAGKIDDKEVERWRTATLKELELSFNDSTGIAVELSEYAAIGDWRTLFAYRDHVAKVTTADVQRVAKAYLKASNRTLGRFTPVKDVDRAPLTEAGSVADYVKDVKEGEAKDKGEDFAATLENIDAHTKRTQLKGGIKTALLAKKTRGGKVSLQMSLHWGDEKSVQNQAVVASVMGSLMMRGTTKKSYQEVEDLQDQLKAHVWVSSNATGLTLHIDTLRDKLGATIDLATEILTQPAFSDKELELVKQEQLAGLEQQLQNPQSVAFTEMQQMQVKWPKSDPRYPLSVQDRIDGIKKLTAGDVRRFYQDFAGAGAGELTVIGDFDADAVTAQVEKLATGWQSKKKYTRLDRKPFGVPGAQKSIDLKDKEMMVLAFAEDFSLRDTDADYAAMQMVNQVLGGDTGARLWMRVREHEGLSYGVGSWSYAGSLDDAGGFGAYAIVAPKNAAKAKASILEEIKRIGSEQVTDAELSRAKDAWIKDQDTNLSNDDFVASLLEDALHDSREWSFYKSQRDKIRAVSVADVAKAAKKYLVPERLIVIDAGDQAKTK